MKLLVLGGTAFVGRALVADARGRGWDVSTFNRGSQPSPEGVLALVGDRRGDLSALAGEWDLVVDTWSWEPAAVAASANYLANRAGHYVYISTRSVYDKPAAGAGDDWPIVAADPDATADDDYAVSKSGGELATVRAFGQRATIARPGCIFGPWEDTGRLPWWINRVRRNDRILAPGPVDLPIQYIDSRDLARWSLDAGAAGLSGAFNTVTESTMGEMLAATVDATGSTGTLDWVQPDEIIAAGIEPWSELPAWLPPGEVYDALHCADPSRAHLTARSIEETVADTWEWMQRGVAIEERGAKRGLDPAKEAAFWAARDSSR